MLTAINATEEVEAFQAFRFQAESGAPEKRMTNKQVSWILNALKRKHPPIAHKLASGAGIDLMYVDSQIAEKIISNFVYDCKCQSWRCMTVLLYQLDMIEFYNRSWKVHLQRSLGSPTLS